MATEAHTTEPVALLERGDNSQLSPLVFNQPTEIADYLVKSENVKTSTDVLVESGINGNARPLEGEGFVESSTVANVVGEQTYHAHEKVDAVEETGTNDNKVTDRSKEIEGKGITNNEFGHVKNECAAVVENGLVSVAEKQTDGSKQNEEEGKETDKSDEQETIREVSSFLEDSLGQTKEAVIHTAEHKLNDYDDSVETITDCIENESKDAVTSTVTEITQESTGDRSLGMAISINQNDSREVEVIENKIDQPSVLLSTLGDQLEQTPSVACKEEHKETEILDKTGEADDSESEKGREEKNPEKKLDNLVSNHEEGKQSVGEEQILSEASAGEGRGENVHTILVAEDSITEVACPEEMPGPKENLMQKDEPENEKIESSQKVSKETETAASNEIKNQEDYFDEEAKAEKSNETNVISDTGIPNEEISPPTTLDEKAQGADVEIENKNADDWHPNRSLEQEITLPEGEKLEKSSDFKHQELVDEESGVSTREETTPKLVSQTTETEDEKLKDVSDSKDNLDIKDAGKNMEEGDPQMEISAASSNDTEIKDEEKSVSNDNIVEQTFEPENIQEGETTLQAEVGEDVKEKIPEENVKSNSQESVGEDQTKDLQSDEKITGQSSTENFEEHETARTINNAVKEKNQTLAVEPITNVKEATDKEDPSEDIKEKDQSTEVSEEIASKDIIEVQEIIQTAAEAEDTDKQDSVVEDKIEVIAREMHEDPLQKEKEDDLDITDLKEEIKDSKTEFTEPVEERGYVEERESETLKDNEEPNSELTPAKASEETMLQKDVNESLAKIPTLDEESKEKTFEKEKHDIDESKNASTATKETKREEGESEDKVETENSTLARGKEPVEMGMESDKLHQMDVDAESENDTNLDEGFVESSTVANVVGEQTYHAHEKVDAVEETRTNDNKVTDRSKIDQPSVLLSTLGDQLELTPSVACKEELKETESLDKTGEADDSESEKGREEKNPEKKLDNLVSNHEEGKQSVGEEQILSEASAGEGRGENVHTILVAEDSITEVACPEEMPGPKENLMQKDEPENEKIESSQKVSKETETAASNEIKHQEDYFDEAKAEKSNETNVISDTGIPNEEISPPTTLDEKAQGADVEIENKNADDCHPNRSLEQEITLPEGEKLEKSSDFKHQELVDEESGVSTREETTPKLVSQTTETEDEKLKDDSDSKDNLDIKDAGKNMEEGDPQMEISAASSNDTEIKDEEKSVSNDNIVEQTFEPENIQEGETTLQAEVGEDVKEKIPEENVKSNSQESVGEDQTKDLQSDEKITGQSSTENFEEHETARTINNAVKEKNQTLAVEPITNVKEATDKEDPREDIKEKDQSTEVSEEIASKDIIEVQEIIQTAAEAEDTDKQDCVIEDKIEVIAREMHEDPLQKEKEDDLDITDLKEEIKDSKTEFTEPVEERGYVEERESETLKDNEEPNSELTPAKASEETILQKDVNESLGKIPALDKESKEETFEKEKHDIDESNNASTATKETKHEEGESEDKVEMENSTLARGKEPVEMGMESDKLHQMDVDAESENDPEIAVVENEVEEQIEHGIQKEAPIAGNEDQTNATASETPSAHMSDDILKECSTMPSQESDLVISEASDIVDENAEEKSKSSLTEVVAEEKGRAEVEAGTDNKELESADTENTEILTQQECASKTMTEESQEIIRDTNQSELGEKMTNFQNESSEFVEQKSQEEGHHETQEKEEPKEPRDHVKETQNADEIVKAVILTEEVQDVEEADGEDKTVKLANEEKEGIKESHTELTEGESGEKAEESMSTEQPKESDSNEQGETVNSDVQEDSVMEKEILITKQTEETLEQDEADDKSSSTAAVQESEEMKKEITDEAYSSHDKIKEITTSETSLDETQIDEKPAQASNTTVDESSLGTVEVEASQQGDVVNSIAVEENSSNLASQHLAENNENATEEQIDDADADADEAKERKKASDVDVVHESVDHYVEASQPSLEFNEDKKDESQDETDERKEAPEVISEASLQTLPVQRFDDKNKTSSELLSEEQEDGISALMDVVEEEEISSDQTLLTETLKEQNQTKKTEEVSLHMELPEEHGIQKESPKEVREDEDCGESKEDIKEVAGLSSRPDFQNFKAPKEDEIASDTTLVTEEKSEEKSQTPSDAMTDETPATSDRIEQHMQEEENIEKNACFSTQGTKEVEALEVEIEKDNVNEVSNKDGGTPEEVLKLQPHENPSEDVESEKTTSSEVQSYEKTMESKESEVKEKHLVAAMPDFVQTNQPKETVDATDVAGNEITNEEIADKKEWESSPPVTLNEETAKESSQVPELTAEERLGDDMIEKKIQNKKVDEEVGKTDDSETIEKEIVEARIAEPLDQAGVKKEINNDSFTEAEEGDNDKEDQIERDLEKQDDQTVVGQGSSAEAVTVTEKESGAEISDVKESVGDVEISSDENLPIAKSGEPSEIPSAREKTEGATSINEYVEVTTKEVEVAEDVSSRTESVSLPKEGDRKLEICHSKCPLDAEEQKEAPKEVQEEEDIAPAETREEIKKEVDCESVSNSDSQGFESTKEEEIISGETLATGKKLEEKSQTPSADLVSEITTLLEKTEDRAKPEDTQGYNKLQTKEREFQGLALEKESKEAGEVPDEAFKLESQENGTEIKDTECPTKNEEKVGLSKETSDIESNLSEETSKSKSEICSSEVKYTQREEAITNDSNELMLKEVINEGIKEDKDDAKGTPLMVGSEVTTKECHQKPEGKPEESLEDQNTMEEPQTEEEVSTEISNAKEAVEDGTFTTDKSLPVAEFDEIRSVALLSEEQKHGASGATDCIKEGMKGVEGAEQPKTMEEVPLQKEESSELGVSQVETQLDKYVLETPKEVHEGEATTKEMEVSGDIPIIMEEASWQKEEPTGPEISESKRPLDADLQKDSQKESAPIETKEESKEEEVSTEISDAEEAVEEDKITSDKSLPDSKLEEEKEIQSVAMLSEEQKHGTSETTECIKEVTEEVEGTEDEPKTTEEVPLQKEEPGELGLSQLETHPEKYIEETPKEVHEGEATAKVVEMMGDVPNIIEEASLQKEEPRGGEISESKQLLDADAQMDSQKEAHEEEDKALIETEEEIKEEEVGTDISESKEAVEEDKNIRDKSLPVAKLEEQNEIQSVALLSEEQKQGTSATTHCMKEVTKGVEGTEVEPKTMEKMPLQKEEPRELEVFQVETQLDKYVQETLKEVHEGEATTKEVEVIGDVPNIMKEASLQKEEPEESEISDSYRILDADVKMESQNEVHAEEDSAPIEKKVESKSVSNSDSQVSEAPKEDKITSTEALTTDEKSEEQSQMPFAALVSETTSPSEKEEQEKAVETPEDDNMKISATPHDMQARGSVLDKDQSLEEVKTINEAVKLASEGKKPNRKDEKYLHESERVTKIVGLSEGTSNIKNKISEETLVSESEIHSNEVITEPGKTETKEEQAEEAIATKIVDNEVINEEVAEHKDALPMTVTEVTTKECHQEPQPNLDESLENKTTEELQTIEVEKSQEEEGKTANAASGDEKTSEAEERGIAEGKSSLQDMLEKPTREWHHAAEETEEAKKEKSGGEEEDEEEEQRKHDSSGSDAPVVVEACREMEIKSPHKKSLLSGVGSKVKHSISKVKKAITGSGGGGKSSSQAKQQHSPK